MSKVWLSDKLLKRTYRGVGGVLVTIHVHWCPGCENLHSIAVDQPFPGNGAQWRFDGNADMPTFSPSINVGLGSKLQCHYFIGAGVIEFLGDCHHELRGTKVPLPVIPPPEIDDE